MKLRASYKDCVFAYYLHEVPNTTSIAKILGNDKNKQKEIADKIVYAVNNIDRVEQENELLKKRLKQK